MTRLLRIFSYLREYRSRSKALQLKLMKVRGYKKFVSVLAEIKVGKMTTVRHQIANLQPKKFALCFFPLDNSL